MTRTTLHIIDGHAAAARCASAFLCAVLLAAQPTQLLAQAPDISAPAAQAPAAAASASPARRSSPYRPTAMPQSAQATYAVTAGITDLKVRRTNAGNLIRFSYKVTHAAQAKLVADRQAKPMLIGHTSRAVLSVPVMDKVGALRQATAPEVGKEYWMVFSNKGDHVKAGERVTVVIGKFRAENLVVE